MTGWCGAPGRQVLTARLKSSETRGVSGAALSSGAAAQTRERRVPLGPFDGEQRLDGEHPGRIAGRRRGERVVHEAARLDAPSAKGKRQRARDRDVGDRT